jgi:hypothetical protein
MDARFCKENDEFQKKQLSLTFRTNKNQQPSAVLEIKKTVRKFKAHITLCPLLIEPLLRDPKCLGMSCALQLSWQSSSSVLAKQQQTVIRQTRVRTESVSAKINYALLGRSFQRMCSRGRFLQSSVIFAGRGERNSKEHYK